jgi:hypothetical protein
VTSGGVAIGGGGELGRGGHDREGHTTGGGVRGCVLS